MKTRRFLAALLSTSALLACASAGAPGQASGESGLPVISVGGFSGIIVPAGIHFPNEWTPTEREVFAAEPNIQRCILAQRHDLRRTLSRFFRQYSGVTYEGRRVLRVDLFDSRVRSIERLRRPVIVVDASGDDYFMVEYDIESEQCVVHRY